MDAIRLKNLAVKCVLGDLPEERAEERTVYVDAELELDLNTAAASDSLTDTVDYAALAGAIRRTLAEAKCRLLERAAALTAEACLADKRVKRVRAAVRKTGGVDGLGEAEAEVIRSP